MVNQVADISREGLIVRSLTPLVGKGRCFGVQRRIEKSGLGNYVIIAAFYREISCLIL